MPQTRIRTQELNPQNGQPVVAGSICHRKWGASGPGVMPPGTFVRQIASTAGGNPTSKGADLRRMSAVRVRFVRVRFTQQCALRSLQGGAWGRRQLRFRDIIHSVIHSAFHSVFHRPVGNPQADRLPKGNVAIRTGWPAVALSALVAKLQTVPLTAAAA